jgi:hypothetical protein
MGGINLANGIYKERYRFFNSPSINSDPFAFTIIALEELSIFLI